MHFFPYWHDFDFLGVLFCKKVGLRTGSPKGRFLFHVQTWLLTKFHISCWFKYEAQSQDDHLKLLRFYIIGSQIEGNMHSWKKKRMLFSLYYTTVHLAQGIHTKCCSVLQIALITKKPINFQTSCVGFLEIKLSGWLIVGHHESFLFVLFSQILRLIYKYFYLVMDTYVVCLLERS